jgi:hypothetical protein
VIFQRLAPPLIVLACCMAPAAYMRAADGDGEDAFLGIERLMTAEEFRDAGLTKLTEDEKAALDQWLIRYTAGEAEMLQSTSEVVQEAKKDLSVESRITGDFTGWTGETYFELENGQLWQQRLSGRYRYEGPANPRVRIERNWLGFYRMTLVDTGRSIGVSRRQ